MTDSTHDALQTALGSTCTLIRELGGGGMSRVFLAEEHALKRRVVVKLLPAELAAELSLARFKREIAVAARLQHPHIVPLLTAGDADGLPWYVMPFVDGETLRDRLARGGEMPIGETVRLLREVASALVYAHDKGVVHRDLKPENVLLTGGIALLGDFGVAKALIDATTVGSRPVTAAGVAVGTPAYMSPEQVSADPTIDERSDLYSFGVLAYEMLAGEPPFRARTTQALLAAHIVETPGPIAARRPAVPDGLAALVMQCLEKNPADRPQSAVAIVHTLDALALPTPSGIRPSPITRAPVSRWQRLALLGAVAGVLATGTWYAFRPSIPDRALSATGSRLLIVPFENLTGDSRFDHVGRIAADRITLRVAQLGGTEVVPSMTVMLALRDSGAGSEQRVARLTTATRAGRLLSGSVVLRGDSIVLQAQVTDAASGRTLLTLEPAATLARDPIAAIDAIADRLLGALGRQRDLPALSGGFRAPKYAAYEAFATGFEKFARDGDNRGSRTFFERAIALDSTYVQAYVLLSRQYLNAGEYDRADSLLTQIERLPLGLTAAERAQIDIYRAELAGDFPGRVQAADRLVALDSAGVPLWQLAEASIETLQPTRALAALTAAEPTFVVIGGGAALNHVTGLAAAHHQLGAHREELRVLVTGAQALGPRPRLHAGMLRALAGLRQPAWALALADSITRDGNDPDGRRVVSLLFGAMEFDAHGDSVTAARLVAAAHRWLTRFPESAPSPARLRAEAVAHVMRGAVDPAFTRFSQLASDPAEVHAAGALALLEIARGRPARAGQISDSLATLPQPWLFGEHTYWRAAIAGALGDRERAVQLLREAHQQGQRMRDWHVAWELRSLRGFAPFDALIRPKRD